MKQPKRLTRKQKECLSAQDLNWREWLLLEETEFSYRLVHKVTGRIKRVDKFVKRRKNGRNILV